MRSNTTESKPQRTPTSSSSPPGIPGPAAATRWSTPPQTFESSSSPHLKHAAEDTDDDVLIYLKTSIGERYIAMAKKGVPFLGLHFHLRNSSGRTSLFSLANVNEVFKHFYVDSIFVVSGYGFSRYIEIGKNNLWLIPLDTVCKPDQQIPGPIHRPGQLHLLLPNILDRGHGRHRKRIKGMKEGMFIRSIVCTYEHTYLMALLNSTPARKK